MTSKFKCKNCSCFSFHEEKLPSNGFCTCHGYFCYSEDDGCHDFTQEVIE